MYLGVRDITFVPQHDTDEEDDPMFWAYGTYTLSNVRRVAIGDLGPDDVRKEEEWDPEQSVLWFEMSDSGIVLESEEPDGMCCDENYRSLYFRRADGPSAPELEWYGTTLPSTEVIMERYLDEKCEPRMDIFIGAFPRDDVSNDAEQTSALESRGPSYFDSWPKLNSS